MRVAASAAFAEVAINRDTPGKLDAGARADALEEKLIEQPGGYQRRAESRYIAEVIVVHVEGQKRHRLQTQRGETAGQALLNSSVRPALLVRLRRIVDR